MEADTLDRPRARKGPNRRSIWKGRIATALCIIPAAYFLLTAAFAIAEPENYLSATPQLVRYLIVPAAIGLGFVLCGLFMRRAVRAQVGLMGIAVLAGLFAFEAKMQAAQYDAEQGMVAVPDAAWMKAQDITGLPPAYTSKGLDHALRIRHLDDAVLGSLPGRRVLLCMQDDGKPIIYRAGMHGFRNADAS